MLRLSTNMKFRTYSFIPPMGRLDSNILESVVKITNSNNKTFDLTVAEYLQNSIGMGPGIAADGTYYSEVLGDDPNTDIFRSLSTKYIPAGASFSTEQPTLYITANSIQSIFHIVSFEDKTKNMSEEAIQQAINSNDQGYTVRGKISSIRSLIANRIITLQDGSELIWKPSFSLSFMRMETFDGTTIKKTSNIAKDFLFWELVDRNVPDSDIVKFLSDTYNLGSKIDDLDIRAVDIEEKISAISNSISSLMYQLDSTKTTVNFLAVKIAEQKNQISALQSSVSSSALQLTNAVDHIDIEQSSNYNKLEDLSQSVQGLNYSLAQLTVLPSKMDNALSNDKNIIVTLDDIRLSLDSRDDDSLDQNHHKDSSKFTAILSVVNLALHVFNMISKRGVKSE